MRVHQLPTHPMNGYCPPLPAESVKLLRAEKKHVAAILAQFNEMPNTDRTPFASSTDTYYLSDYAGPPWAEIRVAPTIHKKYPHLFDRDNERQYFLNRLGLQALAALNAHYGIQNGIAFYNDWLHPTIFTHRLQHGVRSDDYLRVLQVAQARELRQMAVPAAAHPKPRPSL